MNDNKSYFYHIKSYIKKIKSKKYFFLKKKLKRVLFLISNKMARRLNYYIPQSRDSKIYP